MPETQPPCGLFARVGVVLLRPKSPGNVGSVARAMKNMGFGRLIVADPMTYDDPGYFEAEARRMAWQAADLLDRIEPAPDLDAALAPFTLIAGTTSNPPEAAAVLPPRELAARLAGHLAADPTSSAALVFGQEDIGLTREDLCRCSLVGAIPSSPAYDSLNLAQAALLFLYELRLALLAAGPAPREPAPRAAPLDPAPTHADREAFYGRLERTLEEIGFFQGSARPHMMRELRLLFIRAALSSRELAILEGLVHQVLWAARRRG